MMISTYQRTAVEAWADRGTAMVVALKRTRLLAAVVDTIPCPPASRTEELFQSPGVLTVANDTAREQGRPLRRYRDPVPLVHRIGFVASRLREMRIASSSIAGSDVKSCLNSKISMRSANVQDLYLERPHRVMARFQQRS